MATRRQQREPQLLTGDALVRAMVADERLVRETNEAMRELREGEGPPAIFVSARALSAWLDDPSRPDPLTVPPLSPWEEVDPAHSLQMEEQQGMAEGQGERSPELTGDALLQAALANEELLAGTLDAWNRAEAGEPAYAVTPVAIKAWLHDPSRPRPV